MNTSQNDTPKLSQPLQVGGFLLSMLLSLIVGTVVMGTGWLILSHTAVGPQLAALFGISAKTPWYFTRAAGLVAYLLLTASTVWGLLLTTKLVKTAVPAPLTLAMHNILGWLAVTLTGLHALALLFDGYYIYTLPDILVPFAGPYKPIPVGLGIIGLYIMLITSASFSWRKWLTQRWWRRLHYTTYLAYIMATVHGLTAGTDSSQPGMQIMFWGSALLVAALTAQRMMVQH